MKTKIAYFKNATDIMKHAIHVTGTRCKLTVDIANYPAVQTKLEKLSKAKPRKPTIKADKRTYPVSGRYMDTAGYVKAFWELNFTAASPEDRIAFYEPLSKRAQEWPQEPLHEVLDEDDGSPLTYDFAAPEGLPAWLTEGIPPSWLTKG